MVIASWAKYDAARESVRRPGVAVPVTNGHETSLSPSRAAATKDSSVEEDFVLTESGILAFVYSFGPHSISCTGLDLHFSGSTRMIATSGKSMSIQC